MEGEEIGILGHWVYVLGIDNYEKPLNQFFLFFCMRQKTAQNVISIVNKGAFKLC